MEKDLYEVIRDLGPKDYDSVKYKSKDVWLLSIEPINDLLARTSYFMNMHPELVDDGSDVSRAINTVLKAYLITHKMLHNLHDALIHLDIFMDEYMGNGPICVGPVE